MLRKLLFSVVILSCGSSAIAGDYCVDHYSAKIGQVSSELGNLVKEQAVIDQQLADIFKNIQQLSTKLADAAKQNPPNIELIRRLGQQIDDLNRQKASLETKGYANRDRISALKGIVPAELQGELRGCVEATAPANLLVNLAIQSLAILSTGGASIVMPPKALYVDMSAVFNGYPTGGPNSVINKARDDALKAVGQDNSDAGTVIRNPGALIRCPFHVRDC